MNVPGSDNQTSTREDKVSLLFGTYDRDAYVTALFRAALAIGISLAFLFSPLLRFASPIALFATALMSTLGIAFAVVAVPIASNKHVATVAGACFLFAAIPFGPSRRSRPWQQRETRSSVHRNRTRVYARRSATREPARPVPSSRLPSATRSRAHATGNEGKTAMSSDAPSRAGDGPAIVGGGVMGADGSAETADKPPAQRISDYELAKSGFTESSEFIRNTKQDTVKWLASSIVGFNAGGIILTASIADRVADADFVIICYGLALMACFATACVYLLATHSLGNKVSAVHRILLRGDSSVLATQEFEDALDKVDVETPEYAPAVLVGVVACLMTCYSTYVLMSSLRFSTDADRARCAVIEREMMRGTPRRGDLPDVFQALGCRPQLNQPLPRPAVRGGVEA